MATFLLFCFIMDKCIQCEDCFTSMYILATNLSLFTGGSLVFLALSD